MCDYSLMIFPNRLAAEGEILITHKFSTGSIGFASPDEVRSISPNAPAGFWGKVRAWFAMQPSASAIPAVCIPPGARLRLDCIPERAQRTLRATVGDAVTFTEITSAWNQYRDALRLNRGREVLLQPIGEGLRIRVLSATLAEGEPQPVEYHYNLIPRR